MTYKQYLAQSMRLQRDYIRNEERRMEKAAKLQRRYSAAMSAIGLHPLDRREITDRISQLRSMAACVEETHGDSPAQRATFEMHHGA